MRKAIWSLLLAGLLTLLAGTGGTSPRAQTIGEPNLSTLRPPFESPRATQHWPRDQQYDLEHVKAELEFDWAKKEVAGTATLTLAPLNDGLTRFTVDAAEMTIEQVALANGTTLDFAANGNQLTIGLDRTYAAGEKLTVAIRYRAHPRKGLYFRAPDDVYPSRPRQLWTQGESNYNHSWIPLYDFPNDKATSELIVTLPAPLAAISNGMLLQVSENHAAGTRTFHWRQDAPHSTYLISLVAGTFDRHEDQAAGVPLTFYVPPGTDAATVERSFAQTGAMLEWFGDWIGISYPYPKYAQTTVIDFLWGGMENISATTLYTDTLHEEAASPNFSSEGLVAHELVHQWWGDLLTCRDWSHIWLNEAFATFFTNLWLEHRYGGDEYDYHRWKDAQEYFKEDREEYRRPIVWPVYVSPDDLFDDHTYEKGGLVLAMLRAHLGEARFQKALRHYAKKFSFQVQDTEDFRKAVAEATGEDLGWFFDQWLYHAGHPELSLQSEWDAETRTVHLIVEQKQALTEMTPFFRLPVTVEFTTTQGTHPFHLEVAHARDDFHLSLPERPTRIRFDPGQHLLKTLTFARSRNELIDLLRHDPNVIGRIWAAEQLAERSSDPLAIAALRQSLRSDPFYGVRSEVARVLGKTKVVEARDALLDGFQDPDPRVREAVAKALGEFRGDGVAAQALDDRIARDPKTYVVAAAVLARGKGRAPGAFETLERMLGRPSHVDIVTRKAFEGFGELGDPRAIPLALEWSRAGRPPRAREDAILALGKLGKGRPEVLVHLQSLLADPYMWARRKACEALGELGDTDALEALEALIRGEAERRVQREAEKAIAKINRRHASPALVSP